MLRISHFIQGLIEPASQAVARTPRGPVVIWNLVRRCNLTCKHCYSTSADKDFSGELSTGEVFTVLDDLKSFGVPALILSGGEPLMRPDLFDITARAKALGFYVALSSNGTLIDEATADRIAEAGYDYVGVSLDGIGATHDRFRRREGAFGEALGGLRLCRDRGVKVGLRLTLTRDNAPELPAVLRLMGDEGIDRFYLSHLNYAGRGNRNRGEDALHALTRAAMDLLFETALEDAQQGRAREYVSGNNDADGVYLLLWAHRQFPDRVDALRKQLVAWGGNASGMNVANIDNRGHVHPDTMWWHHDLGSVRERPFSAIWNDTTDPLMAGLKRRPRPVTGRCADCAHLDICNGNTRVRAFQLGGDWWAEDPGCYLTDNEIAEA